MSALCSIGKTLVGAGQPVYVIAEIGINHDALRSTRWRWSRAPGAPAPTR